MRELPFGVLMLVAIYGTLKVGHDNYERFLDGKRPVTARFFELPFEMYAVEEYPMLLPASDGERHSIWAEIFDLDDDKLRELDEFEAKYGYWRETLFFEELGEDVGIYLHPVPAPEGFARVPSGKWPS